jgi:hypothetical protein
MKARAMGKWGQSPIYTVSHGPQEIEISPFRSARGRGTQNRSPVRGLFWVGGKNVRNQHALRRLKTVQAWRKSLNEFKAARLTCLRVWWKGRHFLPPFQRYLDL